MSDAERQGGSISATDLIAQLDADPEHVAQRERVDRELESKEAAWRDAEAPLVDELRAAGFEVGSAWDLVNTTTPYPEALPILLDHLHRPYPDRVREGIARALAVRDAKFAWSQLFQLYERESVESHTKQGLAAALAATCDDAVIDELIGLAQKSTHGDSRLLLLRALKRSKAARARSALKDFTKDPELRIEARRLLAGAP